MPHKIGKALGFAVLIWIIGFVWGTVVFMTPALKNLSSIPYVSRYPLISFPLLLIFPFISYLFARNYLKTAPDKASEGLKLGITFAVVNFVLDLLVLVILFKAGFVYFAFLSIWVAYLLLILVPLWVGRSLTDANAGRVAD